jgi:hypothetical protein
MKGFAAKHAGREGFVTLGPSLPFLLTRRKSLPAFNSAALEPVRRRLECAAEKQLLMMDLFPHECGGPGCDLWEGFDQACVEGCERQLFSSGKFDK